MKNKLYLILILFLFITTTINAQNNGNIIIGKKELITSKVLNENRTLWIYTPDVTSLGSDPDKRYPVLYVMDGEAHFYSIVGIIQQLSQANGNGAVPEMIVVGIENTNRFRDLVPSNDTNKPNPFINFLSKELIPFIDKNYKTAPYKILVGHSLGGLTAVDILTNYPELFNAYIAIDPSMWLNNEKYLINTTENLSKNLNNKRLFVGIANSLPKGMKISQVKKDKSKDTEHIRSILKLDKYLSTNNKGLKYNSKYYEKEIHNTVPLICQYDGLRFVFDYYLMDANEKDFADSTDLIAKKLKNHYKKISQEMGFQNAAPEALINYLAFEALDKKYHDKAKALFELNIDWYPNSSNVYSSFADYYLVKNDTINAITNYKKSLNIKESIEIRRKLDALTNKSENTVADDLQKYAGIYILEKYNLPIELVVRENKLFAKVPGQADDEFVPISKDVFTVKSKQGYTVTFKFINDKPLEFTSEQPNGTFKAIYKGE